MRLDQKSLPAKFRPNPLTFRANVTRKTDERRRTPQQPKGRFATLPSARTALKKGTTSLRSVVKKIIFFMILITF